MQNGCPNQASYQTGTKWPIKKKEHMVGKKRRKRKAKRNNKQTKTTFLKERGGKKCQREAGQRLDTRNPCTRYNPLSRQQHGRAKDAHEQRQNERSRK